MAGTHFCFETNAYDDPPDIREQNINGIVGHSLATDLAARLHAAGFDVSEIWDEDHGWDFGVTHAGARYLCACSVLTEDFPHEGHVVLTKTRTLVDRLTGRNRWSDDDPVAVAVKAALSASDDVLKLQSETAA